MHLSRRNCAPGGKKNADDNVWDRLFQGKFWLSKWLSPLSNQDGGFEWLDLIDMCCWGFETDPCGCVFWCAAATESHTVGWFITLRRPETMSDMLRLTGNIKTPEPGLYKHYKFQTCSSFFCSSGLWEVETVKNKSVVSNKLLHISLHWAWTHLVFCWARS